MVATLSVDETRLKEHGYRLTEPRRVILNGLRDAARYLTAQQLYESLRGRAVGLASVYRTLELLAAVGLAEKRAEPAGEASFLYCSPIHHHHVVCTKCHAVQEIDDRFCPDPAILQAIETATGFQIERHIFDFHGLCPECRASP